MSGFVAAVMRSGTITIVTSSAMARPLIPVRAASEPAKRRPFTGTGVAGACSIGKVPGFMTSIIELTSSFESMLSFTLTLVDPAFTTFSTLWSPGVTVRSSKLSTVWPPSITERLKGLGPSCSGPGSVLVTTTEMWASGSTLVTSSGAPRVLSAAGRASCAGSPEGLVFGIRTI